ncbi:MAG: hypothetical protein WCG87_00325 [Bacteroidota bacterium]
MKKLFVFLSVSIVLTACKNTPSGSTSNADSIKVPINKTDSSQNAIADTENDFADYYVAIVDKGYDYYALDRLMYSIGNALHMKVDTLGRYYNAIKKEIVLPENDEDEMYRGEYYPRRDGDDFLSIERTTLYDSTEKEGNMCLVAGLFTNKQSADSVLQAIKPISGNGYVVKASIYMGCLH